MHGYILVYAITSQSSFKLLNVIHDKILHSKGGGDKLPCVIVVGNKSDLNIQRQVSEEERKKLGAEWGCPTIETSAKHNENVGMLERRVGGAFVILIDILL